MRHGGSRHENVRIQTIFRSVTAPVRAGKVPAAMHPWSSACERWPSSRGVLVAEVAGFFYPRTATGRSSLLPAPPWHYSGDLLTVEYRTDPARVAELLPPPLELAPEDPGAVALIWADWQSCGDDGERAAGPGPGPVPGVLRGGPVHVRGPVYSRCVYIWVDADFALARGLVQGYPKKLGSIHQTRPHPFGRAAPRIGAGRGVRRHAGRGGPAARPGGGDAARGGAVQRLRQRAPDGAPPVDALGGEGRAGLAGRADRLRQRVASRPARRGAATPRSSCSSRRPRNWPGWRSARSSAATTGRSA